LNFRQRNEAHYALSEPLFEAIKEEAERSGIPYQRFIRQTLENAVHQLKAH
jgi:predicted DNA binding CopG/RHH family protein